MRASLRPRVVIDASPALAYDPPSDSVTLWMEGVRPRPESEWPRMSDTSTRSRLAARFLAAITLGRIIELALFLRVLAACAVEWRVRQAGTGWVCLFPDAEYYWSLAGTIRQGTLYEIVDFGDIPHFALRTPGYPLFLAACRSVLGDDPLGVRVVQAGLGAITVWLVYRLTQGSRAARGATAGRAPRRGGAGGGAPVLRRHVGTRALGGRLRAPHAGGALGNGSPCGTGAGGMGRRA